MILSSAKQKDREKCDVYMGKKMGEYKDELTEVKNFIWSGKV